MFKSLNASFKALDKKIISCYAFLQGKACLSGEVIYPIIQNGIFCLISP